MAVKKNDRFEIVFEKVGLRAVLNDEEVSEWRNDQGRLFQKGGLV